MAAKFIHEAEFRRERDFGTKVSATFEFLTAQFRPLLKCVAYFVLPAALLCGIGMGLLFNNLTALIPAAGSSPNRNAVSSMGMNALVGGGLSTIGLTVAFLLLSTTVYAYIRLRMDTPAAEPVQPAQVWQYIRPRLGRVVLGTLMLGGLAAVLFLGGFGVIIATLAPLMRSGDVGPILLGVGLSFLVFGFMMWAMVCLSMYFPAMLLEDADVWTSLRRSFYLVRGKWWSTLGLYMVITFIQSFIAYLFAIPMYGVMLVQMLKIPGFDSPVLSVVTASIYAIGAVFTMVLPLIALAFQYFNLVERKDGVGLQQLVNSLGQTPAPQVSNAAFRPDEEGEY
ncbi:hypothetical protein GCM10023185_43500 [Hymenobacter saemangeumensis]|uniref:DUF7847 domain-containing protein n=1 Tax=Hymenobacter saemangeumensis TaxID=1084522 RepID=A0ABP8IS05_9BACT